jgi:hypothetical protein
MLNEKINRRIFIKTASSAGIGILTTQFFACGKHPLVEDPVTPPPATPADEITPLPGMNLYGRITDTGGNPIAGVVVSDSFSCVLTDANGVYQMKKNNAAILVHYSLPADCAVNVANAAVNMAAFYAPLKPAVERYDFTLRKLPKVETDFTLICIGDPQTTNGTDMVRFKNETVADINAFLNTVDTPCYGLIMGDIVGNQTELFPQMKTLMGAAHMPLFTTIGNHDKNGGTDIKPRETKHFCDAFGPTDYSFNRGNVHFVSLDNIIYSNDDNYTAGFTDAQVEWLRQDLSYVSTDKMIILYYHIPIRNTNSIRNRANILDLLKPFDNVHLMCGHTHYNEYSPVTTPKQMHEHVHAAACGSWWKSNVNGDGTPNGYAVYEVSGTHFTNWFYKPTRYSRDFQIRLHRGNTQFGGDYGMFSYGRPADTIIANVWNADPQWKVEAYEDGVHAGNLVALSAATTKDAFAIGYHVGVLNRNPNNYSPPNHHAYIHTLKNPAARQIEIRATDRFGTVYRQSEIIGNLTTAHVYS